MAEKPLTIERQLSREQIARLTPAVQATLGATEQILLSSLGIVVNLSGKDKVVFERSQTIEEIDLRQSTESNELARMIVERELPLPIVSEGYIGAGILVKGPPNAYIKQPMDPLGEGFMYIPDVPQSREITSASSLNLFRDLAQIVIDSKSRNVLLPSDEELRSILRDRAIEVILSAAKGEIEDDVLKLAVDVEELSKDPKVLSVRGKGAKVELRINGKTFVDFGRELNQPIVLHLASTLEQQYIELMTARHGDWFMPPSQFEFESTKAAIEAYRMHDLSVEIINEHFPFLQLPEGNRQLFKIFENGELTERVLAESVGSDNWEAFQERQKKGDKKVNRKNRKEHKTQQRPMVFKKKRHPVTKIDEVAIPIEIPQVNATEEIPATSMVAQELSKEEKKAKEIVEAIRNASFRKRNPGISDGRAVLRSPLATRPKQIESINEEQRPQPQEQLQAEPQPPKVAPQETKLIAKNAKNITVTSQVDKQNISRNTHELLKEFGHLINEDETPEKLDESESETLESTTEYEGDELAETFVRIPSRRAKIKEE